MLLRIHPQNIGTLYPVYTMHLANCRFAMDFRKVVNR